jgi:hypothetical protein
MLERSAIPAGGEHLQDIATRENDEPEAPVVSLGTQRGQHFGIACYDESRPSVERAV